MLLVTPAWALTLEEVVQRAGEVDPVALVAELDARRTRLESAEAILGLGPTPTLDLSRKWGPGVVSDRGSLTVSLPLVDPPAWLDAAEQAHQARAATRTAEATRLDAQYAAAQLAFALLAADARLEAARQAVAVAGATAEVAGARVTAGLDAALAGESARLGLLTAQAALAEAEAEQAIARATLARAIEQEVDRLEPAEVPALPEGSGRSPWLDAAASSWAAARMEKGQRFAEMFPTGALRTSTDLYGQGGWTVTFDGVWTWDGLAGPALRFQQADLDARIAQVQLEALERDLALGLGTARARAQAADRLAEVARARESLAAESLRVAQARLQAGLVSVLETLRFQDEAAAARLARVDADQARAQAHLEARRLAGLPWD